MTPLRARSSPTLSCRWREQAWRRFSCSLSATATATSPLPHSARCSTFLPATPPHPCRAISLPLWQGGASRRAQPPYARNSWPPTAVLLQWTIRSARCPWPLPPDSWPPLSVLVVPHVFLPTPLSQAALATRPHLPPPLCQRPTGEIFYTMDERLYQFFRRAIVKQLQQGVCRRLVADQAQEMWLGQCWTRCLVGRVCCQGGKQRAANRGSQKYTEVDAYKTKTTWKQGSHFETARSASLARWAAQAGTFAPGTRCPTCRTAEVSKHKGGKS